MKAEKLHAQPPACNVSQPLSIISQPSQSHICCIVLAYNSAMRTSTDQLRATDTFLL